VAACGSAFPSNTPTGNDGFGQQRSLLFDGLQCCRFFSLLAVFLSFVITMGGIADMARNGVNGLKVPATDVGALADAITGVAQQQNAAALKLARTQRAPALEECSLELQAIRYAELYASVV
jgi:hypothetical protein